MVYVVLVLWGWSGFEARGAGGACFSNEAYLINYIKYIFHFRLRDGLAQVVGQPFAHGRGKFLETIGGHIRKQVDYLAIGIHTQITKLYTSANELASRNYFMRMVVWKPTHYEG